MKSIKMLVWRLGAAIVLATAGLALPQPAQTAPPAGGSWPFFRYDMQRTNRVPPSVAKGNITQPAIKWRFWVGSVVQPYVVDTDGDGRNEVIFQDANGRLVNLDPYTATLRQPPVVNWQWNVELPSYWHPLNLDGVLPWEYPVVDAAQAPTYTLRLTTKPPSGVEQVIASHTFTNAPGAPALQAVGDFDGDGGDDLLLSLGDIAQALVFSAGAFSPLWTVTAAVTAALPAAVGEASGDAADDLAWAPSAAVGAVIVDGQTGASITGTTAISGSAQSILANLDGDATLEALYAASSNGEFRVQEFTPNAPIAFNRTISGSAGGVAALADVAIGGGLEVVYRLQLSSALSGVLGALSGVNGSDIYTRGLGVVYDATCKSDITAPASYLGPQLVNRQATCPGAMRLGRINDLVVADIDNDNRDEILAASDNGYLYALNAEDGTLRWGYIFPAAVHSVRAANIDNDPQLEVLVSVADGFLYALDQQSFPRPLFASDGPNPNNDVDTQNAQLCYAGHWQTPSDALLGAPEGYWVTLRDQDGALMTNGYLDIAHTVGAGVMGVTLCYNDPDPQRALVSPLTVGRRYLLEVISYKGANVSAPTFSDSVLVQATSELGASSKAVTPTAVAPGGVVTWTIVVRNSGEAPASAQVIDPLPANTSYVAGSAAASAGTVSYEGGNNRIVWQSAAPLPAGQSVVITFATQVGSDFVGGLIRNRAEVVNLTTGARTSVEAAAAVDAPNLSSAQKVVNLANAQQGSVLTYTIRVTNTGALTATGTLVEDPLPAGMTYVAGSLSSSGGSGAASYDPFGKRVLWTGSLAVGERLTVTFAATVNIAREIVDNCARVGEALGGSFQRCARTVVGGGRPSLAASLKTSDRITYSTSDAIVYAITLRNDGTQAAAVALDDVMPAGVTVDNAFVDPNVGSLSFTTGRVQWNGALLPSDVVNVYVDATLSAPDGVLKNAARVTETISGQVYTLTREVLVGTAPLIHAQKFAEPLIALPNSAITYVLRLENFGNAVAAGAVLTDPLPANTSYVPGSALANVGVVTYNAGAGRLEWDGPVYLTQTTMITWQAQVGPLTPIGTQIVNQAASDDGVSDYDEMMVTTVVGIPPGKALIRGYVYSGTGTTPLSGVLLSAAGLVTVSQGTNAVGYAALLVDAQVTPTNYAVYQVTPPGYVNLTPAAVGVPGVVDGGLYDVTFRDALRAPAGFGWVRGAVFNDVNSDGVRNPFNEAGLAGVTVTASSGASMQTLADGSYFFLLPAGSRGVTQTNLAGRVSTTPNAVAVTVASQGAHEVNFGDWLCQGLPICTTPPSPGHAWLYGYVYRDVNGALNAPDGLRSPADQALASANVLVNIGMLNSVFGTDASGFYYLEVPAGTGQVIHLPSSGYQALTPSQVPVNARDGAYLRVDFGVISATQCAPNTRVVNGFVYSDTAPIAQFRLGLDEPTLGEATVTFAGQTQVTNWMYAFVCVPAGSGVVTSTNPAGYTNTTPNSVSVTVPAGGTVSANFGKAFVKIPLALRYAYVPIVFRPAP